MKNYLKQLDAYIPTIYVTILSLIILLAPQPEIRLFLLCIMIMITQIAILLFADTKNKITLYSTCVYFIISSIIFSFISFSEKTYQATSRWDTNPDIKIIHIEGNDTTESVLYIPVMGESYKMNYVDKQWELSKGSKLIEKINGDYDQITIQRGYVNLFGSKHTTFGESILVLTKDSVEIKKEIL